MEVNVIGAGLAGCEATYQLLNRGIKVNLYEMKPSTFTPAHKNKNFAELVCSNSLKSNDISNANGLLKEELRLLNSFLISVADIVKVPAGSSLSVDREKFSLIVTEKLKSFKNLNIIEGEIKTLPNDLPTIIATGPLTTNDFANTISNLIGKNNFYFYDAIAPIISYDSIDMNKAFFSDRYNKGTNDYINCALNKEEYNAFYSELITAETVELKEFETLKVFEGCMPIETLAKRGKDAIRFGPMKPIGIKDDLGNTPYAVVQLRRETNNLDMFNMVGFQTNLKFGEQKRVFSLIPALKNAEFLRYGTMHKNIYINAPKNINNHFQFIKNNNLFFAGQISGVEGYVESIMSGLVCGINMYNYLNKLPLVNFSKTMIGAISNYISNNIGENFQPMSANMGLVNFDNLNIKDKTLKNLKLAENCLQELNKIIKDYKIISN